MIINYVRLFLFSQPAQQFVARVCSTLLKRALAKEVPAITKSGIAKSLADLQQTFINSSVAALEKRGVQIYKLLESMLKTNKESSTASKGSAKVAIFRTVSDDIGQQKSWEVWPDNDALSKMVSYQTTTILFQTIMLLRKVISRQCLFRIGTAC